MQSRRSLRFPLLLLAVFLVPCSVPAQVLVGEVLAVPVGPSAGVLEPTLGMTLGLAGPRSGDVVLRLTSTALWFRTGAPVGALAAAAQVEGQWTTPVAPGLRAGFATGGGLYAASRTDLALPTSSLATSAGLVAEFEAAPALAFQVSLGWQGLWGLTQTLVLGARYQWGDAP